MEKGSIKIRIVFLDGSEGVWDSGLSEKKPAMNAFRATPDIEIDGVYYTKHSVFSWEIVEG